MDVSQTIMPALKLIRQLRMVNAEQMQNRRMQIMDVHRVFRNVVTEIVSYAITEALLDARTGKPYREAARVMISAVVVCCQFSLTVDGTAEFPAPNNKRVIQ